ncbi:hypothetical protein [Paraburkholderia sp. HD33-4]|uniref:hypothetical protein n=1 Tax=Paraburkholderia sp. HD33-4 TaxID=2883242 RepID=UPI001F3E2402|nr:hypothetical protein [Paraburkholderia sp. HD33-4]
MVRSNPYSRRIGASRFPASIAPSGLWLIRFMFLLCLLPGLATAAGDSQPIALNDRYVHKVIGDCAADFHALENQGVQESATQGAQNVT